MTLTDDIQEAIDTSCELAQRRMDELVLRVETWERACVIPLVRESAADRVVLTAVAVPEPPRVFAILCAEVIHHMAAAFDHIAWALVSEETRLDEKRNRAVYMPFALTEEQWTRELPRKLPGISGAYLPLIWEIQPFVLSALFRRKPHDLDVVVMKEFDNFAKHRSHHVLALMIDEPFWVNFADGFDGTVVHVQKQLGLFELGTALLEVEAPDECIDSIVPPTVKVVFRASQNMMINQMFENEASFPVLQMKRLVRDLEMKVKRICRAVRQMDRGELEVER